MMQMQIWGIDGLVPLLGTTYYQAAGLAAWDQWWHWFVFVTALGLLLFLVARIYRYDGRELPAATRRALLLLRLAALAGIVLFFLQIEKRDEERRVRPSRALLLVDTSQSMGLADLPNADAAESRAKYVAAQLNSGLVDTLRQKHDVVAYRFDDAEAPLEIAALPRFPGADAAADAPDPATGQQEARGLWASCAVFLVVAAMGLLAHLFLGAVVRNREGESWALLVMVGCLLVAGVFAALRHVRQPQWSWNRVWNAAPMASTGAVPGTSPAPEVVPSDSVDWEAAVLPRGLASRLGDALRWLVDQEQGGPIAGVITFTDGNNNAGIELREAQQIAQNANIPIHFVGLGSDEEPTNLRVVDVEAPSRVYPGDPFQVRGFVQGVGRVPGQASVQLKSRPADDDAGEWQVDDEQTASLESDGQITNVVFEVAPTALGERTYAVEALPVDGEQDLQDNQQTARVQVLDRKNKVLLLAGGPTREYRFVRGLCYRDVDIESTVILQTSPQGAAQEADVLLDEFPRTPEALFDYDCLVAFDPDWSLLDAEQADLLERWIAERAAGLLVIAGPVHTPEWTTLRRESRMSQTLKGLYPVQFFRRSASQLARGGSAEQPLRLALSSEGQRRRAFQLGETAGQSDLIWGEFPGVYANFPISEVKPGATVLAETFATRQAGGDAQPFAVEQYYGAGRVLYLGSGEIWRFRVMDTAYFEQLYTQWIRHVSQGRLLRDSNRGVLLLSHDRGTLGQTVVVRAVLTNAQFRPLADPTVTAELVQPDGVRVPLLLTAVRDTAQAGNYVGQFTAVQQGEYGVELVVPDSPDLEVLRRFLKVRVPDLELESPQRNGLAMASLAQATGGQYYAAPGIKLSQELADALVPQDQDTYFPGTPDRAFQERLLTWLMVLICGALSLEWLLRRLNRLA